MPVGTSLGAYYDSDFHHLAGVENNVIDPETSPDLGTRDQNVKTPKGTDKTPSSTASTMPVGGPTEPAGALESEPGTLPPPKGFLDRLSMVNAFKGMMNPSTGEDKAFFETVKNAFKLSGDVFGGKIDPMSDQGIERATDLAGLMITGPAPVAAKMADGTLGSFMGVKSKTFDRAKLAEAQQMESNGAYFDQSKGGSQLQTTTHPDDIWDSTGTFKGADGRWRQEIPDKDAKLRDSAFDTTITPGKPEVTIDSTAPKGWGDVGGTEDKTTVSLRKPKVPSLAEMLQGKYDSMVKPLDMEKTLDHPELYKAYPELRGIKVEPFPYKTASYGMYSPGNRTMYLADNLDPAFAKSVILHETQHAIQDIEGFARGGSSQEFISPELQSRAKQLDQMVDSHLEKIGLDKEAQTSIRDKINTDPEGLLAEVNKAVQKRDNPDFVKLQKLLQAKVEVRKVQEVAFEKYQRLMGEVEARNVQTRRDFNELSRKANSPGMTEDRPLHVQINPGVNNKGFGYSEQQQAKTGKTPVIKDAALKIDDEVFTGANHYEAYEKATRKLGEFKSIPEEGFTTQEGKFVDREEAMQLSGIKNRGRQLDSADDPDLHKRSSLYWKNKLKEK